LPLIFHAKATSVIDYLLTEYVMSKLLNFLALLLLSVQIHAADFILKSNDVAPKATISAAQIYSGFGCTGGNLSPQLSWSGTPSGTQSFALTVYDPDAPTGSGWWHWVVIDIPATATALPTGAGDVAGTMLPKGSRQMRTDFGTKGYGGPCPPPGDKPHRYIFILHALKTPKLEVPDDASAAFVGFMIHGNELASATFTAYYDR
jgi:Raf kinase inhibitor-like YbhB/YbcL family protein